MTICHSNTPPAASVAGEHNKTNAHGRSGVMYASELMEKVIKEPEKYEGKRYKGYPIKDADGNNYEELIVKNGNLCIDDGDDWAYINSHTQLEEIPQPVTWQEALEAFAKGKRIKLVIPGLIQGETVEHIFKDTKTFMLQSDKRYILTADTFLNGTWYILD